MDMKSHKLFSRFQSIFYNCKYVKCAKRKGSNFLSIYCLQFYIRLGPKSLVPKSPLDER
jgi:hypothetical protein